MNPADVRVVFMGSPAFAVPSLRALAAAGYAIVAVVTQPDRPAGRGGKMAAPAVKLAALELGLDVLQPERVRGQLFEAEMRQLGPDIVVVAAFGKILPQTVLDAPARGCVNVHASLLPRWRGASPIAAAIREGDAETGISIMEMALAMDAGPVITKEHVAILPKDTTGSLEGRLAEIGAQLLVEALPGWYDGHIRAAAQDETLVTVCGLVTKADGHLRSEMTAGEAERAVRASNPWPGAYAEYRGERLGIWAAHVEAGTGDPAGTLRTIDRLPAIAFARGLLMLDQVQRPGGKRLTGQQFLAGERGRLASQVVLR